MRPTLRKQAATMILMCCAATGLLSGCFGGDEKAPATPTVTNPPTVTGALPTPASTATVAASTAGGTPVVPPTVRPGAQQPTATAQAVDSAPQPLLTLAVNNSREADLYQGWPLLIEASLMHPDAMRNDVIPEPLVLGTDGKPWTAALKIEIVDSKGKSQVWPLHIADAEVPSGAVTLNSEEISTVHWWLGSDETASLPEGLYAFSAVLDTSSVEGGNKGEVKSLPAVLRISKSPAKLTPEQEALKIETQAAQAVVRGDSATALSQLEQLLAKQPDNIAALEFKGDLLASDGKTSEALETYNRAIKVFFTKNPDAQEPPTILQEKQHDMVNAMLEKP